MLKQHRDSVVNLSKGTIEPEVMEIMNSHLQLKFDFMKNKSAIEKLYYDNKLHQTQKEGTIACDDQLKMELKLYDLKQRQDHSQDVITKEQQVSRGSYQIDVLLSSERLI